MSKIFITGVAGFIGSHIAKRILKMGLEVIGIDSFTDYYSRQIKESNIKDILNDKKFTFIEGDILEVNLVEILRDVEYIFHEAAQAGVRASWGQYFDTYVKNNILTTQRLLEVCKDSLILKKIIYASSSSVYGETKVLPMAEDHPTNPVSPYGVSKLAAEHLCMLYWKNFGVPTVSLRYFTVYGPGQRPDMGFNKFIKAAVKDEEIIIYGDGNQTRDFTFVSDIVDANILAMESDVKGEIFNIGGGIRISVLDIIEILRQIIGKQIKITNIAFQKGDVMDTFSDTSKAASILGYSPKKRLQDGLQEEYEWLYLS